jgi:hypothetical protein
MDVYIHVFLTSALVGGEWSPSRPSRFTPKEKAPSTHWIRGLVDPRAGLDDVEKSKFLTLPGLELRPLGRPARSQSLYRLRYPGSFITCSSPQNSNPVGSNMWLVLGHAARFTVSSQHTNIFMLSLTIGQL